MSKEPSYEQRMNFLDEELKNGDIEEGEYKQAQGEFDRMEERRREREEEQRFNRNKRRY